jgi:hypothetical protein
MVEEDPDWGTAFAAHRHRLLVRQERRVPETRGAAAVNAISNASGSIMLKKASADSMCG